VFEVGHVLNQTGSTVLTDRLLLAHAFLGVTLLESGARVVLPAHTGLSAVDSVLAVEDIGAVQVDGRSVDVLDHV
jgi:hypothetical protein